MIDVPDVPPLLVALGMSLSICTIALATLAGVAVWWIQDQRGRRRAGRRRRRVRYQRTSVSSRGQRPFRGGRVRVY